jgi:hypothetical protein
MDMQQMSDVISSFRELIENSKDTRLIFDKNNVVDVSISYSNNSSKSIDCGDILLLSGGKENYLPETLIKTATLK